MQNNIPETDLKEWKLQLSSMEKTDEEIFTKIREIAKKKEKFPYFELAEEAFVENRYYLALKLIERESDRTKRVNFVENCFFKSVESGNPDLILLILLKLRLEITLEEFIKKIRNFPFVMGLYKKYCQLCNKQNLHEIHVKENNYDAQASSFLSIEDSHVNETFMKYAAEAFGKSNNDFNAQICSKQLELLKFQMYEMYENYIGKTVHETCLLLLKYDADMAEQFKNDFEIPERRFCWLKMQSLIQMRKWRELETLSKDCPLTIEAFFDACLQANNKQEAEKYLSRMKPELRVKGYIKIGHWEEAAKLAYKQRDIGNLQLLRSIYRHQSEIRAKIASYIDKLENRNKWLYW